MKVSALLIIAAASLCAVAQDKTMAPADTNAKYRCMMAAKDMPAGPGESRPGCPSMSMGGRCFAPMPGGPCFPCRPPCGPRHCRGFVLVKLCAGLAFLAFCVYLTVNILLTILVAADMKQRGRFKGLWIPPLLIAAIPVSIIYALLRLGDMVKEPKA